MTVPSARAGLQWFALGRDRRHPFAWLALLLAAIGLAFLVLVWLPFAVLGLLVGAGSYEAVRRHGVPSVALPVAIAGALVLAAIAAPLLLVGAGGLVGMLTGRKAHHGRGQLVSIER